jgi:3-dehydroquinate synthetase
MVDSSIGGKTAVDLPAAKNLVGAFFHPEFVLTDASALTTLPQRALREGWAEAIKHGLALEADLVDIYEEKADALLALEPGLTAEVVARNAAVKARIVSEDERETGGLRSLLNYGHTMGHGLEAAAGYDAYLHGEAVSVGMMGAARLGMAYGVTPADVVERQSTLLRRYGLPQSYSDVEPAYILEAMSRDKKISAGEVSWVFLEGVGKAAMHHGVPPDLIERIVRELRD